MPANEKVKKELPRFELVEWLYDGINGKIIPWTKQHGGTSNDPSVQAFVVAASGEVVARSPDGTTYGASAFAKWLLKQALDYAKKHPRTRVPFKPAEVRKEGVTWRCPALSEAQKAKKPVLLYFGREARKGAGKAARKEAEAARKLESKTLDSKSVAAAAKGWVLLRFDLAEEEHRAYAKTLGVSAAPALLAWTPGAEKPEDWGAKITASSLAYRLKKLTKSD
ncbi:MAG: hypothetical protein ACYTDY_02520 [Planctomycetota bacterium]